MLKKQKNTDKRVKLSLFLRREDTQVGKDVLQNKNIMHKSIEKQHQK
jgi:hypothetical protein